MLLIGLGTIIIKTTYKDKNIFMPKITYRWTWNGSIPSVCQKWVLMFLTSSFDCRRLNFVPET